MSDAATKFLEQRGIPEHLARHGLSGLLESWELTGRELAEGWSVTRAEFVQDLEARQILAEAEAQGLLDEHDLKRLSLADRNFAASTKATQTCTLDADTATKRGYTAEANWWYWREPVEA